MTDEPGVVCTRCDHDITGHKIISSGYGDIKRRGPCTFKTYDKEWHATPDDWHCTCYSFTRQMGVRRALSADQDKQ